MSDLISRQAVIKAVDKHTFDTDEGLCLDEDITCILEDIPTSQPEIIRCKDCKHFGGGTFCHEVDAVWDENSYCSYAERKEQDE